VLRCRREMHAWIEARGRAAGAVLESRVALLA
jgi:hypothetical protein